MAKYKIHPDSYFVHVKCISEIKTGCNCDNFQAFAKDDCIYLCYLDISLFSYLHRSIFSVLCIFLHKCLLEMHTLQLQVSS